MTSVAVALDASPSAYQPVGGLSGQLKSVGSETLGREVERWAKDFMTLYPDVKIDVEHKGSATAPATLLRGISQLAPMSRFMTSDEAAAFETKYGYKATGVRVELTPNFGDGRDQAAAWACDLTTSIPSVNFIPRMTFGNWL
jgi:phosphate transport system substrate-binding protein